MACLFLRLGLRRGRHRGSVGTEKAGPGEGFARKYNLQSPGQGEKVTCDLRDVKVGGQENQTSHWTSEMIQRATL